MAAYRYENKYETTIEEIRELGEEDQPNDEKDDAGLPFESQISGGSTVP